MFPFLQKDLTYGFSDRYSKSRVAVQHVDADLVYAICLLKSLTISNWPVVYTIHLCFDAASTVISAPTSLQSLAQITLRIGRIVTDNCFSDRQFLGLCILAWRDHCMGGSGANSLVEFTERRASWN